MVDVKITREQNSQIRNLVKSHIATHKNWIATAVEGVDLEYALRLVTDLRKYESLLHVFIPDELIK